MMNIEVKTEEALKLLLENGYVITSLVYNKDVFGDILIVVSNNIFDIRFVSDRQDYMCQIVYNGETYFISDVFDALDIKLQFESYDFFDFVTKYAVQFVKYEKEIINSFSVQNFPQTRALIKKHSKERVFRIFGL